MKAFALALAVSFSVAAAAPSLTVWIPEQGQTATLGVAGLVGAAGNRIPLNVENIRVQEKPLGQGFARFTGRLTQPAGEVPAHLEVMQGGKVTASRTLPEAKYKIQFWGTQRGPCLSYSLTYDSQPLTRCFSPDLKTEWAKVSGQPFVGFSGTTAYTVMTDWQRAKPVSDDIAIIRHDLTTGQQVTLSYHVPLAGQTLVVPPGMVDPLDRRAIVSVVSELSQNRLLICAGDTIPKTACRLDIVDRDFNRLLTLQDNAYGHLPQPTKDGKKLYFLGNTLQVWDTHTGKRLASIHDPLWDKRNESAFRAYLTPDNTQAVIFARGYDPKVGPILNQATAYVYRLSDGKRLNRFAVKP